MLANAEDTAATEIGSGLALRLVKKADIQLKFTQMII